MITYGGQPLLLEDPSGALAGFLDDYLPLEDVRQFGWIPSTMLLQMTSRNYGGLPLPNYSAPLRPKINTLYHPTGASRWSFGFFLADTDTKDAIVALDSPQSLTLSEDGTNNLTFEMYLLPPWPLSSKDAPDTGLWLLPLVDRRYYWQFANTGVVTALSFASWTALYSAIAGSLNITLGVDAIPSQYLVPSPSLQIRNYDNAAVALDAVAASVGQRIVWDFVANTANTAPDPSKWRAQNFGSGYGLSRLGTNESMTSFATYTFSNTPIAGDKNNSDKISNSTPSSVQVIFQKAIQNHILTRPTIAGRSWSYLKEVFATNFGLTSAQAASKLIRTAAVAAFSDDVSSTPTNQTAMDALATQIAQDYYASLGEQYDRTYAGLKVWQPCAYDDWIEWSFGQRRNGMRIPGQQYVAQTRVHSMPVNFGVDEQFQDASGVKWFGDIIEGFLYQDLALPSGTASTAQFSVYECQSLTLGPFVDSGVKVTLTNRDATFDAPAGTYLMCRWIDGNAEWRPIPTISPADMFVVGTLAGSLASGGSATLNLQKWNGTAWVSAGSAVTVYEYFGLSASLSSGTKIGAMWHEQAARYIAIIKPGC